MNANMLMLPMVIMTMEDEDNREYMTRLYRDYQALMLKTAWDYIIENSLAVLRQELNNVGLKVENVQVYAGLTDGGLSNGQGGQAWQQNRQQRQGNRRINLENLERDADFAQPVNESSATDGVDYSV